MLYDIYINVHCTSINETVEARDEDEAKRIASDLQNKRMPDIIKNHNISSSVTISEQNYRLKCGGIYLIKRYLSYFPATCTQSGRYYGHSWNRQRYLHSFTFLITNKDIDLIDNEGKPHKRIGKKLCDDGKISIKCTNCQAQFICFTRRK